jgi:hypothetical protein
MILENMCKEQWLSRSIVAVQRERLVLEKQKNKRNLFLISLRSIGGVRVSAEGIHWTAKASNSESTVNIG